MRTLIVAAATAAVFVAAARADEIGDKVTVTIEKWRKPASNNIGTADITIANDNDFAVRDIRVRCDYVAKSGGRKIETEQNIAVRVKARARQLFKKTKFPFIDVAGADGGCKVIGASQI